MADVLDVCCGSKMFYFQKKPKNVIFSDIRDVEKELCDGRKFAVHPDVIADFRELPFDDESFYLVVFDPPHLVNAGDDSFMAIKYGKLKKDNWKDDLYRGFCECWRVLKPNGVLVFKWSEVQIKIKDVLNLFPQKPLLGNRDGKNGHTHWLVFYKSVKGGDEDGERMEKDICVVRGR